MSASSSKACRGWRGLGLISSTGSCRRSRSPAPPCVVLGVNRAASPRPIPRLGSATLCNLLGQLEVGIRPGAVRIVMDDGAAVARRLAEPDVPGDHGVEDELGEVPPDLRLDVLGE